MRRLLLIVLLTACDDGAPADDADAGVVPAFPRDVESAWTEMRDCRHSHEHDLRHIRVFADPGAEAPYAALSPDVPYPVGATLVKLEYELPGCKPEEFRGYTVLRKEPAGYAPDTGDWRWQAVDPDFEVVADGVIPRCVGCHRVHCKPPDYGFDFTCADDTGGGASPP